MKKIIVLLLLIILGLVLGLARERARYDESLKILQQSEVLALSECSKTVAELKFQCQANDTGFKDPDPIKRLTEFQVNLQNRRLQAREKTVDDLIVTLELDTSYKSGIFSTLEEFDRRRRALIGQSRQDSTYLTPAFHEDLNKLREDTGRDLKENLTDEQWSTLVANDFLRRLGLSRVEPSETSERPIR